MKLVLDNNSLFSIMNPKSIAAYLFFSIKADFIAPEFIKKELDKYKEECLIKSNLSEHEFKIRQKEIEELIEFFEESKYDAFLTKAILSLPDPKDAPYLALALLTNSAIWSNDSHLKEQSIIKVYTTKELADFLINQEL